MTYNVLSYEEVMECLDLARDYYLDNGDTRGDRAMVAAYQFLKQAEQHDQAVSKLLVHLNIDWQEEDDPED